MRPEHGSRKPRDFEYNCAMGSLLPRIILTGLAASVSPVAIMVLISVMTLGHPGRNSLLFLLGFTITLVAIGVIGMLVFGASTGKGVAQGYVDIGLGVLCFVAIPLSLRRKQRKVGAGEGEGLKASRAFVVGIIAMLINTSTMVIYIAGTHAIAQAKLAIAATVLSVVILTAVTLVTLIIPIALYLLFPTRGDRILGTLNEWLMRHNRAIGIAILLIFGVYLIVKGIAVVV